MWAGWLAIYQVDRRAAYAPLSKSVALWQRLGDARGQAWALGYLAFAVCTTDLARARSLLDKAVALFRQIDDRPSLGRALVASGYLILLEGDPARARATVEEGLALVQESRALDTMALATRLLGQIASAQGDCAGARSYHQESLALFREAKFQPGIANRLSDLGDLWYLEGDDDRARTCYQESLRLRQRIGQKNVVASALVQLAYVALRQDLHIEARAHLAEALALYRGGAGLAERGMAACGLAGAGLAEAQEEPERAARLLGAVDAAWMHGVRPLTSLCPHVHERLVGVVRAQLDESTFEAAWAAGHDDKIGALVKALLAESVAGD